MSSPPSPPPPAKSSRKARPSSTGKCRTRPPCFLNNVLVTGTNQTVSPAVTTTYTLLATNEVSTATAKVKVLVDPRLDLYDAAIASRPDRRFDPPGHLDQYGDPRRDGWITFRLRAPPPAIRRWSSFSKATRATGDSRLPCRGARTPAAVSAMQQWENTRSNGLHSGGRGGLPVCARRAFAHHRHPRRLCLDCGRH